MISLKNFIHKGINIIYYKRSYTHPLINQKCYNSIFNDFTISKIWNVKTIVSDGWFSYEKNCHICWEWKVEIINNEGKYVLPLSLLYNLGLYDRNGKRISDNNLFIFYR